MNFLYQYHDLGLFSLAMARFFSGLAKSTFEKSDSSVLDLHAGKAFAAEFEIFERTSGKIEKPKFDISSVFVNGVQVSIVGEYVLKMSFCKLKHFKKKDFNQYQEKILIVAPLSGHFASLLRDTVLALLPFFDVYVTDWEDAALVPLDQGDFSLESYVDYVLEFIKFLGSNSHVLAVCQPVVPVLIATALTHQLELDVKPKSMILMGGPVDARINPTKINTMAKDFSLSLYERFIISTIPHYYPGAGRLVCPGFMMLFTFMSMNLDKHFKSHMEFIENSFEGDESKISMHRKFYDEYFAVMDLPAQYFLDSIHHVFQEYSLPRGVYEWKGVKIDLSSISQTALMTIEGEHDDISGLGQTKAAHDLCLNISDKKHYQNPDVGHYGIFSGHRWREVIVPEIISFVEGLKK